MRTPQGNFVLVAALVNELGRTVYSNKRMSQSGKNVLLKTGGTAPAGFEKTGGTAPAGPGPPPLLTAANSGQTVGKVGRRRSLARREAQRLGDVGVILFRLGRL